MLKIIKELLLKVIDNIDSGNSNISEDELIEIISIIKNFTDKTKRFSKYLACQYLGISRALFDKYISEGNIPKGTKEQGFKELSWSLKDLDKFKKEFRKYLRNG